WVRGADTINLCYLVLNTTSRSEIRNKSKYVPRLGYWRANWARLRAHFIVCRQKRIKLKVRMHTLALIDTRWSYQVTPAIRLIEL
ncbi:hypothetical protein, partial [Vibrio splendidus]|uniref:hypothetical protein n=1 Tax=Vibrio splendidus TaxID=29497 RepID=UPI001A7E0C3C